MKTPRKHADLIKAWADGATLQGKDGEQWFTLYDDQILSIMGLKPDQLRIKPEPVLLYCAVVRRTDGVLAVCDSTNDASVYFRRAGDTKIGTLCLKFDLEFDHETATLISATLEKP